MIRARLRFWASSLVGGALLVVLAAGLAPGQDCATLLGLLQQGLSSAAIARVTGLTVNQVELCRGNLSQPSVVGPQGPPPLGAAGPPPFGAAGPPTGRCSWATASGRSWSSARRRRRPTASWRCGQTAGHPLRRGSGEWGYSYAISTSPLRRRPAMTICCTSLEPSYTRATRTSRQMRSIMYSART